MKTEDLQAQGLSEEQIKYVMENRRKAPFDIKLDRSNMILYNILNSEIKIRRSITSGTKTHDPDIGSGMQDPSRGCCILICHKKVVHNMKQYKNQSFDEERALYGSDGVTVRNCRFEGPADGESALKESRNIEATDCYFDLRYPFWHDTHVKISGCEMTSLCRAALWYSECVEITDTKMFGIKAVRECSDIRISGCEIVSPEFGWFNTDVTMRDSSAESEYFMLRSGRLTFRNVRFKGKYSFQYITDSLLENCEFDTKDAFWHARNVVIKNSLIKGEYLAWYCENVTFENCTIIGTQPLCYCKGLRLINCKMLDADLAFEKSDVEADITTDVISIKNPRSGTIRVPNVSEMILDDPDAKCRVIQSKVQL